MTATELRARVCEQAQRWIGIKETGTGDKSHLVVINIYNTIKPLPRGYKMTQTDPWCAAFVSAVGAACGLEHIILPECACNSMIAAYKARGRWKAGGAYAAQPGDLIFYDWGNDGSSDHVGIVVDATVSALTVIEGNYSDSVSKRTVNRGYEHILGFAVPDYESAATGTSTQATEPAAQSEPVPMPSAPREICTVALPVLRYGDGLDDPNDAVAAAQELLKLRGFRCGFTGADGEFGEKTGAAVEAFQRFRGIAVDGVIGKETWTALLGFASKTAVKRQRQTA